MGELLNFGGFTEVSPLSPPKNLHFQIEALGCLSSFSGAYHDSEICVRGALWVSCGCFDMGFSLAIWQHLSIRCNLVPKVFRLHLLVPVVFVGRLQVNACRHGLVPMGGMTYVLGTSTLFNQAANHQITVDGSEIRRSKTSWGNSIWHPHSLRFPGIKLPSNPVGFFLGISGWHQTRDGGEVSILAMAPWWISSSYGLASSWSWLGVFGSLGVSWMSWDWMITNYENGTWINE